MAIILHMINYFLIIILQPVLLTTTTSAAGFSLEMIHPLSLRYPAVLLDHANLTKSEKIERLFNSSSPNRLAAFTTALTNITPPVIADTWASYVVILSFGTPEMPQYLVMDTGSHITWLECPPCEGCQADTYRMYNPISSASHVNYTCLDVCPRKTKCSGKKCAYDIRYGDGSYSKGVLEMDDMKVSTSYGPDVLLPEIIFGCSHEIRLTNRGRTTGILGMSRHTLSFIRQVAEVKNRFSYCLFDPVAHEDWITHVRLGDDAGSKDTNPNFKWTPFVNGFDLYFVNLTHISVQGMRIQPTDSSGTEPWLVDSGSTVSHVKPSLFTPMAEAIKNYFHFAHGVDPLVNDKRCHFMFMDLCYEKKPDDKLVFPEIIFHFEGGADLILPPENAFYLQSGVDVFWLLMKSDVINILGSWQQHDFRVLYELRENRLYFGKEACKDGN